MEIGRIFFLTATINKWHLLLEDDRYKDVIVSSLDYLSQQNKIDVFAFVIMPNHIHLIWRTKEKPIENYNPTYTLMNRDT